MRSHWNYEPDQMKRCRNFSREVLDHFDRYMVPVIELGSSTLRQAVCQVFEKVNIGGVTLTVFELLTATYAADEFDLRKDWEDRAAVWSGPEFKVVREVSNTDY